MKKRIVRTIIILIVSYLIFGSITFLIVWLLNKYYGIEFWSTFIISISIELIFFILSFIIKMSKRSIDSLKNIRPYFYSLKYKNEKIRLSFAYLIRIKVNNRYLLVKSGHKRDLFGPVGGVYHIEHIDYVYKTLGFARDSTPGDSQDVRGTILGKNIEKFIEWFNRGKNRETSPLREFCEELLESELIPKQLFDNPTFSFLGTKYKGISYSDYYHINELLRFDIYELVLNEEQIKYIEDGNINKKSVRLFSKKEIESLGITEENDKRIVGTQTSYILED